ncbi:hypothetical protein N7475_006842 [Penicillium sp. IBT 31633x]|nr:hypothetical protein N7475_006842 [Penicillium sp. IBT 31633x]
MAPVPSPFHGIEWGSTLFDPMARARWTLEPDIRAIKQTIQSLQPLNSVEVAFLCEGGYNKVYDVKLDKKDLIMRIALPVDPYNKTLSEVATMNWIRRTTNIPIPVPLAYDASNNNTIGFSWILMTKMPGKRLGDFWESLSLSQMINLTQELAQHVACLFQNQLRGIGSITERRIGAEGIGSAEMMQTPPQLVTAKETIPDENSGPDEHITLATGGSLLYHKGRMPLARALVSPTISTVPIQILEEANHNPKITTEGAAIGLSGTPAHIPTVKTMLDVGQIVSPVFFWGSNIQRRIYRGPFHSSHDWLKARLELNEHSCVSTLENASKSNLPELERYGIALAAEGLVLTNKLKSLLPHVFPLPDPNIDSEPSVLVHEDLSTWNMLLSDDGELSAILDWEMIAALPLWKACDYPYFLQGPSRNDEPNIADYSLDENGEIESLYWQDMWEHRRTLLRSAFLHEMEELAPEWVEIHARSEAQRDFDIAVSKCAIGHYGGFINEWIEGFTGEGFSLGLKEMRDAAGMESY